MNWGNLWVAMIVIGVIIIAVSVALIVHSKHTMNEIEDTNQKKNIYDRQP